MSQVHYDNGADAQQTERPTRRPIRSRSDTSWQSLVSYLLIKLENGNDIAVTTKVNNLQCALLMISPIEHEHEFQVVFLFGERRWRRRRSMYAAMVAIIVPRRNR